MCEVAKSWTWCSGRSDAVTEAEWLEAADPALTLEFIRSKASDGRANDRKLQLFAVAGCHRVVNLITPAGKNAVVFAEQFADGHIDRHELTRARVTIGDLKRAARRLASVAERAVSYSPSSQGLSVRVPIPRSGASGTVTVLAGIAASSGGGGGEGPSSLSDRRAPPAMSVSPAGCRRRV
jgi:hypothetical protein